MAALETHRMREIVKGLTTTSDKIRALDEAGFDRADIARFLDKRYQHVRNVLVAPRPKKKGAPSSGGPAAASEALGSLKGKVQVGAGGRVVIPAEMRSAMGVAEGDTLHARVIDGELRLMSQPTALRRAQELVRRYIPEGTKLVDELIAERRAEARREDEA
ncbi:AbrB/MazE/SpoVT family DNA-binding domain-containing protein [Chelativorans sp.]|uniref:AbrB/MazE/SpoVT family DNA-binding domain-containing protein n=1 Tax=Chelativorans sp. TaxID=2203393 RepID=UPI00281230C0|nr:AbrB/MazE/SpoVT family DNA-binding domain-containing protein [Chelativorans sp.]